MKRQFNFGWLSTERAAIMGFAILWVVFYHSLFDCSSLPVLGQIKKYGHTGVDIFLLLSGVGLYYACQKYGMGKSTRQIYSFYRGRLKRILPATVICMLPWHVYLYIDRRRSFSSWRFILDITSLSYWINGVNRAWYVALSLILYAIYPAVFFLLLRKCFTGIKMILYAAAIIAFTIAGNSIIALLATSWFDSVELALTRIPIFLVGCFFGPIVKAAKKCSGWFILIAVIAVMFLPKLIQLYRKTYTTELLFLWRYLYSAIIPVPRNGLSGAH